MSGARAHGVESVLGALDAEAVATAARAVGRGLSASVVGERARSAVVVAVAASAFANAHDVVYVGEGVEASSVRIGGRGRGGERASHRAGASDARRLRRDGRSGEIPPCTAWTCRRYPTFDEPEVLRALAFAATWHAGQRRKNGELYVKHCVERAKILATRSITRPKRTEKSRRHVRVSIT